MDNKLEVRNLSISFKTNQGTVKAVRQISFQIKQGETLAIVGESGSGKSVTAKAILGILAGNSVVENGEIIYDGQDLLKFTEADFNRIRGNRITMIFQDPLSALNPIMKIGKQLTETIILNNRTNQKIARQKFLKLIKEIKTQLIAEEYDREVANSIVKELVRWLKEGSQKKYHYQALLQKEISNEEPDFYGVGAFKVNIPENTILKLKDLSYEMIHVVTKEKAYHKAIKIMEDVGIKDPEKRFHQYPFEFSGGMRQRIVIAIALAANPDLLICDEPTTALDVTIQAQILELINDLKRKRNLTVIFITHDLGVVANIADKVAVMYAGKIVEEGSVEDIFYRPAHPYTWALLSSMPDLDTKDRLEAIPGTPPNMLYPPIGDAFAARNQYAMEIDFEKQPPMFRISESHSAATWLLHPNAPVLEPPKQVLDRIRRMQQMEDTVHE